VCFYGCRRGFAVLALLINSFVIIPRVSSGREFEMVLVFV